MTNTNTTNTVAKVTKRERFAELKAIIMNQETINTDLVDFINHEVELLDKKRSGTSKASLKAQEERKALQVELLEAMQRVAKPMTVSQIVKESGLDITTSKATSMLRKMMEEGTVTNVVEKKVSLYSVA